MTSQNLNKNLSHFKNFYFLLFSKKILWIFLAVGIAIFIICMYQRYIHIDENWFGEQAYWLAKDGVVKIKSLEGLLNFDEQMFTYHKLFVILGALVVKVFGWSVYPLKALTLVLYLIFLFCYYKYYQQNKDIISAQEFILAVVLIVVNPIMMVFGFTFRPEIMVMFLGFISYLFLERYLKKNELVWLVLAGVFSGLTFFTHLTGLIFPVAGFFVLLLLKRFKAVAIYFVITTLVSLLYTYDLWAEGALEAFIYEFKNYPILQFGNRQLNKGILGFLEVRVMSVLTENKRYLWSYYVFPLSVIFLLSYILNFKYLIRNHLPLIIFCTTLMISLAILSSYKAQHYLIYFYPYMAIIAAIGIYRIGNQLKWFWMFVFAGLFILQVYYLHYELIKVLNKNNDFVAKHAYILDKVPAEANDKIMVPWDFIFNELQNYNLISDKAYIFPHMETNGHPDQLSFYKKAHDLDIDYIVYDQVAYTEDPAWGFEKALQENEYYNAFKEVGTYIILKKKTP